MSRAFLFGALLCVTVLPSKVYGQTVYGPGGLFVHPTAFMEPSGSRANFTGESTLFRLPATNTRANISWRWHQYAQWVDQRMYIAPQIPAEATSADHFNGRDQALEAILDLIGRT